MSLTPPPFYIAEKGQNPKHSVALLSEDTKNEKFLFRNKTFPQKRSPTQDALFSARATLLYNPFCPVAAYLCLSV